ncbi:MAG: type II CAAX endopeptidase family protein [Mycobacteriales bacterium]
MIRLPRAASEDPLLPAGLAAAYVAFGLTFRGPRERFWQRMTGTGLGLGTLALASSPELRRTRLRPRDAASGLGSAAVLYGVFLIGDKLARRIMPSGDDDIGDIYALRTLRPPAEIALRLAAVIGPAEELFWRGFVQPRMQRRLGQWPGAAAGSAAYGLAHVVTGNATLVGAASVAGAFWSALAAAGVPMGSLVASHVAWDIWTFLVAPTGPAAESAR